MQLGTNGGVLFEPYFNLLCGFGLGSSNLFGFDTMEEGRRSKPP